MKVTAVRIHPSARRVGGSPRTVLVTEGHVAWPTPGEAGQA